MMILIPWWFYSALWLITAAAILIAWTEYPQALRKWTGASAAVCVLVAALQPVGDPCNYCREWPWLCWIVGCS